MCSSKLSKSLLNPEKVQGSTILKPLIKSGHRLPITSIDAPGSIHSHTTSPRRSTHQTFIASSPIWLLPSKRCMMVLLTHRASAKTWKRCKQRVKRTTRGKTETFFSWFFEKALHLHWKTDLKSRNDLFWPCFGTNGVWSKKRIPNLKQLVLLGFLIRRTPCVQMCTNNYVVHLAIHTKSSTHSYQVWNMTKLWLNTICQNYQISPQTEDNGFSKKSKRTILSSLHDLPTKIDFPKTITASIFKKNVIILEKTVQKPNPEKVEEM